MHAPYSPKILTLPSFDLECGVTLTNAPVAYQTYGTLSATGDNVIVVCHALTGSADVGSWWQSLVHGKPTEVALDSTKYFIICLNCMGSPYGTASPLTPRDGNLEKGPYGPNFPSTTVRDDVRLFRRVLDTLGVRQVMAVIGGSMGGMHVLEFAYFGPQYIKSIIPIATSASLSAWGIGWGELQRQCIYNDPNYKNGFYTPDQPPIAGLATARVSAMLSYRSSTSFQARFGRRSQCSCAQTDTKDTETWTPGDLLSVQSYLRYQGDKFVNRFDANCYIALTHKLDSHDLARGRAVSIGQALSQIQQPTLILAIRSDVLFTFEEQLELQRGIPNALFREIASEDGHDGFLLESGQINRHVREFLDQVAVGSSAEPGKSSWLQVAPKFGTREAVVGIGLTILFWWTLGSWRALVQG